MTPARPTRRAALELERRFARPTKRVSRTRRPAAPRQTRRSVVSGRGAAALLLAWLFAVSQGLPAYGAEPEYTPVDDTPAPAFQSVTVDPGRPAPITRDQFTVTALPKPTSRLAQGRLTFLNTPGSTVQWPFDTSPISSGFGKRIAPCNYGCSTDHRGLDFTPGAGTPIRAVADGIVRQVNRDRGGFGTHVIIEHEIEGRTVTSLYAHMAAGSVPLVEGEPIAVGSVVGNVGNTGLSTGAHLHLEISVDGKTVDPYGWLSNRVR